MCQSLLANIIKGSQQPCSGAGKLNLLVRVQAAVCQSCAASLWASTRLLGSLGSGQTLPPGYPRGKGLCDDGVG